MWTGALMGFAGIKFSVSIMMSGEDAEMAIAAVRISEGASMSFHEKRGWNEAMSILLVVPVGLEEPFECRVTRWTIDIAAMRNGIMKCKGKNRFSVGFETEYPPHNHWITSSPKKGIVDAKLVITVAPQKDICPQGNTYPKKAVAISIRTIVIPEAQVSLFLKDELMIPRKIWM